MGGCGPANQVAVEHSHDLRCPLCPGEHGGPGPCDQQNYSRRRLAFIRAHQEAYDAAYTNPDPKAASNELERLRREWETLPFRHACTCPRLNRRTGIIEYHCLQCRKIGDQIPKQDIAREMGRTSPINAPMPLVVVLDLYAGYAA